MKKWTKKYLKKELKPRGTINYAQDNAKKAEKKLGLPKKLWLELSEVHPILLSVVKNTDAELLNVSDAFMIGVAVGWAEKNRKIL